MEKITAGTDKQIERPARIIPPSFKKHYAMWRDKEITGVEFAKLFEVSRPNLYRYIREYEESL